MLHRHRISRIEREQHSHSVPREISARAKESQPLDRIGRSLLHRRSSRCRGHRNPDQGHILNLRKMLIETTQSNIFSATRSACPRNLVSLLQINKTHICRHNGTTDAHSGIEIKLIITIHTHSYIRIYSCTFTPAYIWVFTKSLFSQMLLCNTGTDTMIPQ